MRWFTFIAFLLSLKSDALCTYRASQLKLVTFPALDSLVASGYGFGHWRPRPWGCTEVSQCCPENKALTSQPNSWDTHSLQQDKLHLIAFHILKLVIRFSLNKVFHLHKCLIIPASELLLQVRWCSPQRLTNGSCLSSQWVQPWNWNLVPNSSPGHLASPDGNLLTDKWQMSCESECNYCRGLRVATKQS